MDPTRCHEVTSLNVSYLKHSNMLHQLKQVKPPMCYSHMGMIESGILFPGSSKRSRDPYGNLGLQRIVATRLARLRLFTDWIGELSEKCRFCMATLAVNPFLKKTSCESNEADSGLSSLR